MRSSARRHATLKNPLRAVRPSVDWGFFARAFIFILAFTILALSLTTYDPM
ncbi:MAG: hypothetical protein KDE35_10620 [Geminicoccaceae bacterium]|nr:hypothetical protein [Geminicoccaceae bacterium]